MGFLKWIRRELDSPGSCKRRQSEPPIIFGAALNSDRARDESYIRAIFKFNEWRNRHRIGSNIRCINRKSSKRDMKKMLKKSEENLINQNGYTISSTMETFLPTATTTTTNFIDDQNNGIYEEICSGTTECTNNNNNNNIPSSPPYNSSQPISSCTKTTKISPKFKTISPGKFIQKKSQNVPQLLNGHNNDIYEFENNYCKNYDIYKNLDRQQNCPTSPPKTFYKENSNPFKNHHHSGNKKIHHHYDCYGGGPKHPKNVILQKRQQQSQPPPIMYTKTTIQRNNKRPYPKENPSFQSSFYHVDMDDTLPDVLSNPSQRFDSARRSPSYQRIINKKGEEVEYALPFNEKITPPVTGINNIYEDDDDDDDDHDTMVNKQNIPQPLNRFEKDQSLSLPRRSSPPFNLVGRRNNILVTDLDKSDDNPRHTSSSGLKAEILKELNSLETWSKNINLGEMDNKSQDLSLNDVMGSSIIMQSDKETDIIKDAVVKSNGTIPISLTLGYFRKMNVTKFHVKHPDKFVLEKSLQHNFLIMRKIRHPNISLLMATATKNNRKFSYLILEPFRYTLNHLIYKLNCQISIKDCLDYATQISKAVLYLHENGLIHSNISSHSVFVCRNTNNVKLSSFELTTFSNNRLKDEILSLCKDSSYPRKMSYVSGKYLPHYIEYRKIFSQHFYQSPELITTDKKFIFPCIQTDVYGIILTLWEMLNAKIPYDQFDYYEMKKIFSLKQAQLPNFEVKRCEHFEAILDQGLRINHEERIQNVDELYKLLKNIKYLLDKDDEKTKDIEDNILKANHRIEESLNQFTYLKDSKTSTMKKKKRLHPTTKDDAALKKQSFDNPPNITEPENRTPKIINPNEYELIEDHYLDADTNKGYQFEIDQLSLPDTPIARNNKIRKAVWLTNNTLSPISPINNYNCNAPSIKKYNLNITIIQNNGIKGDLPHSDSGREHNNSKIQSHINYWNSLSSSIGEKNTTESPRKDYESIRRKELNEEKIINMDLRCDNEIAEYNIMNSAKSAEADFTGKQQQQQQQLSEKNKFEYYPSMPELLSEAFRKRNKTTDEDFERILWKREKEKCEQNSPRWEDQEENEGVLTPKRISVKEAVNKFEKITSYENDNNKGYVKGHDNENGHSKINSLCTKLFIDKSSNANNQSEDEQLLNMNKTTSFTRNVEKSVEFENFQIKETIKRNRRNWLHDYFDQENNVNKLKTKDEKHLKDNETNVSKLDVMLRNNPDVKLAKKVRSNPELHKLESVYQIVVPKNNNNNNQNMILLGRSRSDVGCSTTPQRTHQIFGQFGENYRHSIGSDGAEFLSRQEKITLFRSKIDFRTLTPKLQDYTGAAAAGSNTIFKNLITTNSSSTKLYRHITCRDCGSHNVALNERIKHLMVPYTSPDGSLIDMYRRKSICSNNASIEDLYIDDDFKQQEPIVLGTNPFESHEDDDDPDQLLLNYAAISNENMNFDEFLNLKSDCSHKHS